MTKDASKEMLDCNDSDMSPLKDEDVAKAGEEQVQKGTGGPKSKPILKRSTILVAGFFCFLAVFLWPPVVLLATIGLAFLVPHWFHNSNTGASRRRLANASTASDPGSTLNVDDVTVETSYWVNQRGMSLFTMIALPKDKEIQSVVCCCHDYMDHSMSFAPWQHKEFAKEKIACVYIQYEGHGKSDGPLDLIPSWNTLVADVSAFFLTVAEDSRLRGKPMFLLGTGVGSSVAYSVYNSLPYLFSGAILLKPNCHVGQELLPPKGVAHMFRFCKKRGPPLLKGLKAIVGPLKKEERAPNDECSTSGFALNPYLITDDTFTTAKEEIQITFPDFEEPFLVFPESDDEEKCLGRTLFAESKSEDKTIMCSPDDTALDSDWKGITANWIKQRTKKAKVDWIDRCIAEIENRLHSGKKKK